MKSLLFKFKESDLAEELLTAIVTHPVVARERKVLGIFKRKQMKAPRLVVTPEPFVNAEAYIQEINGMSIKHISVNSGALRILNREQLNALLAHEVCHHIHEDYKTKARIAYILTILSLIGLGTLSWFTTPFILMAALPIWIMYYPLAYATFQKAELRADALAAKVAGKEAIISLLSDHIYHTQKNWFQSVAKYFRVHPTREIRIQRIKDL